MLTSLSSSWRAMSSAPAPAPAPLQADPGAGRPRILYSCGGQPDVAINLPKPVRAKFPIPSGRLIFATETENSQLDRRSV
jgi:hypothetical protein